MSERCETCRFWTPPSKGAVPPCFCKRYPPNGANTARWPQTQPQDWCGEWQAAQPRRASDEGGGGG
jgi:hypothetical protein